LNVPASQARHGPPSGPVNPRLQVQFDLTTLPFPENEAEGQFMQPKALVWPVAFEYVPSAQALHPDGPLISLYVPALQAAHGPPSGPL